MKLSIVSVWRETRQTRVLRSVATKDPPITSRYDLREILRLRLRIVSGAVWRQKLVTSVLVTMLLPASFGFSTDFSAADALFKRRGEGYHSPEAAKVAREAKAAYEALLPGLTGQELLYAMGRLGDLYIYLGNIVTTKEDKDQRLKIFGECENAMERINPKTVGENPVYYYTRGSCTAMYAESGNMIDKLARVDFFKKGGSRDIVYTAIDKGFETYRGGGIYRIASGVLSNGIAKLVGLYRPEEAISMLEKALALPADDEHRTGQDYCENYHYLVLSYLVLGTPDKAKATQTLNQAIEYFAASRDGAAVKAEYQPEGREPETIRCLELLYQLKDANNL